MGAVYRYGAYILIELNGISTWFDGWFVRSATGLDIVDYTKFCQHLGLIGEGIAPSANQSEMLLVACSLVDKQNIRRIKQNNLDEFLAQPLTDIKKAYSKWAEINNGMLITI